jgi:hypothetical protein
VLIELANHNDDIRRLLEKGYALRFDSGYLVVRYIPYLDANKALQVGAIVTKLVFIDKMRVQQQDHQVFFAGSAPHGLDGQPVPNLFAKIEHYLNLVGGPAMSLHGFNPFTFRVDHDVVADSVFKFQDTMTSRAEIGDLAAVFKNEVIAIIGLGGTGCFVLDFTVKTPVQEIRGFDGDFYYVHNAYRSPGHLDEQDLGKAKAEV